MKNNRWQYPGVKAKQYSSWPSGYLFSKKADIEMDKKTAGYRSVVWVHGTKFSGIEDIHHHAVHKTPKDGVYVGYHASPYGRYDDSDWEDDRCYWHFVFATSLQELEEKTQLLHKALRGYKFEETLPQIQPVVYWIGSTGSDLEYFPCLDIIVQTPVRYLTKKKKKRHK